MTGIVEWPVLLTIVSSIILTVGITGAVLIRDIVFGWGTTDPIRGAVAEWVNTIIAWLFGSGTTLAVARMALTRLGR